METIVKPVETRRERKQFLSLPWQLYRDDPNWIPPLRQNQKELVGYARHPFHEVAEVQTFLAFADGQPCGRIAAILNHAHNKYHNERLGFWGFFESIDDQEVANELFDAVRQWLAERDIHQLRGPCNPSLNYECGLLIEGFHSPPTFMMTYNPPYYQRLVEGYGFRKSQDLFAYWGPVDMVYKLDKKLAFIADEAAERFDIKIRPIDKSRFQARDRDCFSTSTISRSAGTWGFVPLSKHEIEHMSAEMKHLIIPELALFATVDGEPIGAVFGMPDYNPRIKQIDGRLFPFGFLTLLNKRKPVQAVSRHRHGRDPRISEVGSGPGAAEGPDPQGARLGAARRRSFPGCWSRTISRAARWKKGGAAGKDVPHLRLSGPAAALRITEHSGSPDSPNLVALGTSPTTLTRGPTRWATHQARPPAAAAKTAVTAR